MHLLVPSHGLGNPCGVEVGHLKLQVDHSVVVAGEHRQPQGGLDVVLAQGDLVQVLLVDLGRTKTS